MTGRLFLVDAPGWPTAAVGDEVEVGGAEGRHAVAVVRVQVGDHVLLGGSGRRAEAVVTGISGHRFSARLVSVGDEPAPQPRFVLVQALAKGGRDEQAVETATELGVDEVVPWQAGRGVVVWRDAQRAAKGRQRWQAVAAAATKQSRRSRVPDVAAPAGTPEVAARLAAADLALVLHEDAETPLAGIAPPDRGDVVLVVGPEGGITPEELAAFGAAGATAVRLGRQVLRSSSAGPAALAVLSAAGRWR
jgi:16S rRNA (uracil1498-N3)-methyltransferase